MKMIARDKAMKMLYDAGVDQTVFADAEGYAEYYNAATVNEWVEVAKDNDEWS